MRRLVMLAAAAMVLAGCTQHYDVYLMGRSSADQARSTIVVTAGHPGGDFAIQIRGKQYLGRWIYVANGGAVSLGTAVGVSGTHVATGNAMAISTPTEGGGSIFAAASDGSALHCQYGFNAWSRSGVGLCQDNGGEMFDLQINPS